MEQPISIDKNQHAADVLQRLNSFRQKKKHCDFVIKAGTEEIAVHRNVLSACSDYFDAMLSRDTLESQSGVVEMKDVDPGCVSKCVDFMYTGVASVSEDNREQLMHVAHMLQLSKLCNGITLFLEEKLDLTSFFFTKKLANLYSCKKLVEVCNDFALQNFCDIAQSKEFNGLEKEYIQFLVGSKNLKANEETRCRALIGWIKHDALSRERFLVEMIGMLDLLKISLTYKRFLLEHEAVVNTSNECLKMLMVSMFESVKIKVPDSKISEDVVIPKKKGIAICDRTSGKILSYDISSKAFTDLQPMNADMLQDFTVIVHKQHLYVFVNSGKLYRIQYSKLDATWEKLRNRNLEGYGPAVVLDGAIYTSSSLSTCTQFMERYDVALNEWTLLPRKNAMVFRDAVAVTEGKIFCIGGRKIHSKALSQVQKYDPVSSTWSNDHALNTARYGASAASWESGIYVIGGRYRDDTRLSDVEYRCPKSKTWIKLASMNVSRNLPGSVAVDGKVFAVGGDRNGPSTIEEYDPGTKRWRNIHVLLGKKPQPAASVALIT